MITEIKKPLLIPRPGEAAEAVRDNFFGAKWPPETVGDLPGYNPSSVVLQENRAQAEIVKSTRTKERNQVFRKVMPYLGVLAAAATLVGASAYNKLTQPKDKAVEILVQPYDNPSTVAQRAESRFGSDPADFNIHQEALRLADKYGVLHAGDHLKVFVK